MSLVSHCQPVRLWEPEPDSGGFLPTPPLWKAATWASSCPWSKDRCPDTHSPGQQSSPLACEWPTRGPGSASLGPWGWSLQAPACIYFRSSIFQRTPMSELLVWVTRGVIAHSCSQMKWWLGQLYQISFRLWTMAAAEHVFEKSSLTDDERTLFYFLGGNEKIDLDPARKLYFISPWVSMASLMEQCVENSILIWREGVCPLNKLTFSSL